MRNPIATYKGNFLSGTSLYDEEGAAIVPEIMKKAAEKGVKIQIPTDYICADKFAADAATKDADDTTGPCFS